MNQLKSRPGIAKELPVDLEKHYAEFHDQGFSIIPNVLDEELMARLRKELDVALDEDWERYGDRPGKAKFIALDLVQYGGAFLELLDHPAVDEIFAGLLGDKWILYSFTSTLALPHQDQYTATIHNETARIVHGYDLSFLIQFALSDFTEDNGATYYMPGSHRTHPEPPDPDEFYANAVRVVRKAGDVVFFHPRVWHAGGMNETDETRYACVAYGCRSFMRQRLDFPRMVSPALLRGVSERVRRILGYNVRVPTNMDEFYVPEEERLYKGGQG